MVSRGPPPTLVSCQPSHPAAVLRPAWEAGGARPRAEEAEAALVAKEIITLMTHLTTVTLYSFFVYLIIITAHTKG